jgi:hypothetical protein
MRNRIRCMACNKIIESKTLGDYQECGCRNFSFVDGGQDRPRWGAMKPSLIVQVLDDGKEEKLPIMRSIYNK